MNTLRALVNNQFKKSFFEEKKKINGLIVFFFIFYKNNVKIFLKLIINQYSKDTYQYDSLFYYKIQDVELVGD